MSKKAKYEPHPRLGTKVVPSETDYDRRQNRYSIEEYLDDMNETNDPSSVNAIENEEFEEFVNAEGDATTAQEMYENGFHIEMPEK